MVLDQLAVGVAKQIWTVFKLAGFSILMLFGIGLGLGTTKGIPEYAHIAVDKKAGLYMNPICAGEYYENPDELEFVNYKDLPKGLNPHRRCRDAGGLSTDGRSVSMALLESAGILSPLPSRWNEDGTWNW